MKKLATMRKALSDPALLGDALPGESWSAWRTLLIAAMGEPLLPEEREVFTKLTGGREHEPGGDVPVELLMIVGGRRSGKSCALSILATYLACLVDWSDCLRIGEVGSCLYQAPTLRQAENSFSYATAFIDRTPLLKECVQREVQGCLSLRGSVELRADAANWRYSRGCTCTMAVLDECAFFRDENSDNSDEELLTALMPSLATTGGPMCIASSPKAMEGVVYKLHKQHFGKDGDPQILVVQADSRTLNPTIRESVVQRALLADPEKASSEYLAEFREATSGYLERGIIEKAVEKGIERRTPLPGIRYFAFLDSAGGSGGDSYALAIGHNIIDGDRTISVIDQIYSSDPPFDPDTITQNAAALIKAWGLSEVYGDNYGGGWPVTAMARHGVSYVKCPLDTSELYLHTLPLWNSGRVRMLDNAKCIEQFARLRRRVGQGVQEKIVHRRNGHDDMSNVVAGVLWRLSPVQHSGGSFAGIPGVLREPRYSPYDPEGATDAYMRRSGYGTPLFQPKPGERSIHSGDAPLKGSAISTRGGGGFFP
jgi:hypothetical protein